MSTNESAPQAWEAEQQRLRHIINALAVAAPEEVVRVAREQVARRGPLPTFRDPRPGETYFDRWASREADGKSYREYVATRLQFVWAMRREAAAQNADQAYQQSLWRTR